MSTTRLRTLLPIALAILMLGALTPACATPPAACPPGTYQTYISLGSTGCILGDKLFHDFTLHSSATGGAPAPTSDSLLVTPLDLPDLPTLDFSAAWQVGDGQTVRTILDYTIDVLPAGGLITAIGLRQDGVVIQGIARVFVDEMVCGQGADLLECTGGELATLHTFQDRFAVQSSDLATLLTPTSRLDVRKDINLFGGDIFPTAELHLVENSYTEQSQVPEPATLLMLGAGMLGLVGVRRWHRAA